MNLIALQGTNKGDATRRRGTNFMGQSEITVHGFSEKC